MLKCKQTSGKSQRVPQEMLGRTFFRRPANQNIFDYATLKEAFVRLSRSLLLVFALLPCSHLAAQQNPQAPLSPTLLERDPQAVNILTQAANAAGGIRVLTTIQDFKGNGTITYYWGGQEIQGNATLKGRGTGQFRLEALLPDGLQTVIVNNGTGSVVQSNGPSQSIPFHDAVNLGSLTFPFAYMASAAQDSAISVTYLGLEMVDGKSVQHIHTQRMPLAQNKQMLLWSRLTSRDYYIDPVSLQLIKTSDLFHPKDSSNIDIPHDMVFADYRVVDGVLVPFSINEYVAGQHRSTIQLSQITLNTGLSDSDFQP
jgi:outer membrane lipoprotein-sorting protein